MATTTIRGEFLGIGQGMYDEEKDGRKTGKEKPYWNFQLGVMGGSYKFKEKNVPAEIRDTLPRVKGGMCDVLVEITPDKEGRPQFGQVRSVTFKPVDATNAMTQDKNLAGAAR